MGPNVYTRLAGLARQLAATASYELAVEVVAFTGGMEPERLRRRRQKRADVVALQRRALYLAVIRGGFSRRRIARVAGVSQEWVARACRAVEDERDDPFLDRLLDELELIMIG